jgi:hypothetical protein
MPSRVRLPLMVKKVLAGSPGELRATWRREASERERPGSVMGPGLKLPRVALVTARGRLLEVPLKEALFIRVMGLEEGRRRLGRGGWLCRG